MGRTAGARSNLARSLDRSLVVVVVLGLVLVGTLLFLLPLDAPGGWILALFPAVVAVYLGAGVVAWYRRPSNKIGSIIIFGGIAIFLVGAGNTGVPAFHTVQVLAGTLPLAIGLHLLHAFPAGRLRGTLSIAIVSAGYFTAIVLQAPLAIPGLGASQAEFLLQTQSALGVLTMVATAIILVIRVRQAGASQKRVLIPVYAYGAIAVIFLKAGGTLGDLGLLPSEQVGGLQLIVLGGIPCAFLLGMLRGGFARTGELDELGTWLGSSSDVRPSLQSALASTLGDPSLALYFWASETKEYVDAHGAPAPVQPAYGRAFADVRLDDQPIGRIDYDAEVNSDPEHVLSAGKIVAIAIEGERLTAELLASRIALRESRERLVNAADRERMRIARDLHDGLQVRLVLLAIQAQHIANDPEAPDSVRTKVRQLRESIDSAARELRVLVHRVQPAALLEGGVVAAIEDLLDRLPLDADLVLDIKADRLAPPTQNMIYFVIAEALTNVVKHADATSASVTLVDGDGVIRIEIDDNGRGDASISRGTGIRGLQDRVDVAGGVFDIRSNPGEGTRISVEVPCAS